MGYSEGDAGVDDDGGYFDERGHLYGPDRLSAREVVGTAGAGEVFCAVWEGVEAVFGD